MRSLRVAVALSLGLLPAFLACVSAKEGLKGAACDRASECAAGLFCVEKTCTDDLSKLDGGTVANFDSGGEAASADGEMDAPGEASGDAPPVDTMPPTDTGTPPEDTGTPPTDTGTPPDTFTPPPDTFTPPPDTAVDDTATVG